MKKRVSIVFLVCVLAGLSVACGGKKNQSNSEAGTVKSTAERSAAAKSAKAIENMSFDELKKAAKGTVVTFYGWGGDAHLNQWLDDVFSPVMKEKYDITMDRVPMDIDQILSQLAGEKQAGKTAGSIDMIWLNGENFKSAKENKMLFGPFVDKLPNYNKYVDISSEDVILDFAYPIEGYEAPYGKAQMVMINDSTVTPEMPGNAEELLEFVKKYPGKVTYPALPDFTGSAFIRNMIYEICGYEQFLDMAEDKETVKKAIIPALDYLKKLNPFLWKEGATFPDSSSTLENMFADGEVVMNMSYDAYGAAVKIADGVYPDTVVTFQFDKGTIGNTNFIAIAGNSENKAGAIAAINEMLSPEVQASRYENLKTLPAVDYDKLSTEEKAVFDSVDLGEGTISQEELLSKRLPEMPAGLVPIIEELWQEEVVGK